MSVEVGHRVDEPADADTPDDAIEVAVQRRVELGDDVQCAELRCVLSVFDVELSAEFPDVAAFPVPL